MGLLDYTVLALYFCGLLVIGYYANRKQQSTEDYYVGGRGTGTMSLAALWMSSWVGGASIIGTAEKSFEIGISSLWYPVAMFLGFIVFALTFAARIKEVGDRHRHITYPDLIEERYDTRTRLVSTITTIVAYVGYTASQLLSAAHIITTITGMSLVWAFCISTAITIAYTSMGGFFAVEKTDRFQALLIILGVTVVATPLTLNELGSMSRLSAELPPAFFETGSWGWGTILAMCICIMLTFFTSMDSYTRCYAARTKSSARNGTLLAAVAVLLISGSVCFLGMSAKVMFPDGAGGTSALVTLIMYVFPAGVKGLMLVAILSAIMSTADACILNASANLTRDIYQRFVASGISEQRVLRLSVVSSVLVGTVSALVAWFSEGVIELLMITFTINSAGLFLPTLGAFFWKRATAQAAFWSMSLSLATVLLWYAGQKLMPGFALFDMNPLWPGLAASAVLFISLSLLSRQGSLAAPQTDRI